MQMIKRTVEVEVSFNAPTQIEQRTFQHESPV